MLTCTCACACLTAASPWTCGRPCLARMRMHDDHAAGMCAHSSIAHHVRATPHTLKCPPPHTHTHTNNPRRRDVHVPAHRPRDQHAAARHVPVHVLGHGQRRHGGRQQGGDQDHRQGR
jgi:hypothetical protein